MGLKEYQRKRNFSKTPEPKGAEHPSRSGQLYIIQKHAASRLHYDFRLEIDGVLKSWAVPKGPCLDPAEKRLAVQVEDHPLEYGSFEGIIPEGQYGGGTVMLWDRGRWIPEGDPARGYEKGRLKFRLEGEKLHGTWSLVRMGRGEKNWLLIKSQDEEARSGHPDVTEELSESVESGRSLEEIAEERGRVWGKHGEEPGAGSSARAKKNPKSTTRTKAAASKPASRTARGSGVSSLADIPGATASPMPREVKAQLATLVKETPAGDDWFHEIKFDGYRILAFVEGGKARLVTRNGKDWTERFAAVAQALAKLPVKQAILDGEVVSVDAKGRTNFQALQNALTSGGEGLLYYAFDLLYLDGHDLRKAACADRAQALRRLLETDNPDPERLRLSAPFEESGPTVLKHACSLGLEGIISKRRDAPYQGRRTETWLKSKCIQRQEFVIGGYTDPAGSRTEFGALLVGVHDEKGRLKYAGQVGTGFTNKTLRELGQRLRALESDRSPFGEPLKGRDARGVHWVRPELVGEVEFTEWTQDGRLRHPSFQGLREDKPAREVVAEKEKPVESVTPPKSVPHKSRTTDKAATSAKKKSAGAETQVAGVRLTSPDKILYADQGLTKLDLAQHYERVADLLLPHIQGRPLMLIRCPSGSGKKCFVQRRAGRSEPEEMRRIEVMDKGKPVAHLAVEDRAGLIALAQMGVLEVHAWGAFPDDPESPGRITFDLDPGPGTEWKDVAAAARQLRERLTALGFVPFLKLTGGRGVHVVVPIRKGCTWDQVEEFSRSLAQTMAGEAPERYLATMSKAKREGRIFIDYLRNSRTASTVAPYSPRARAGAPVSVPITWEELGRVRPGSITVKTLPARLKRQKADPWADFESSRRKLTAAMMKKVK